MASEITISKFKATCLAVIDEVRRTGTPVRVTKFGKPVADVVAVRVEPAGGWLGWMAGSVEVGATSGVRSGRLRTGTAKPGEVSIWEARHLERRWRMRLRGQRRSLWAIDQPKVSAMPAGEFRGYSVGRLMRFLLCIGTRR